MVEKVLKILNKEFGGLHQAAFLLGSFAILSQVLALLRDRIFAHAFGAGNILDIYYAAFRVPDLIYAGVASLVSATVLIPFIIEKLNIDNSHAKKFFNDIFTIFFLFILAVSTIIFFIIPVISPILFPGFSVDNQNTLIGLSRILLLSPILFGVSNLFGSVTQTFKRFFVYALSPILYNIGIIFGILFLYPIYGITGLGFGVIFGAILHLLIQVPVVVKQKLFPKFSFSVDFKEIKRVAILSLPRTLGLSANHIAILVLISLASSMAEGSIAVFNLSFNLQSVPLSIIGVSYSVAAFPTLARLFSEKRMNKFMNNIITAARHILFWSLPILVLFIVLRAQIVRTILGSGKFGWEDTMLTAALLAIFSVSLLAQSLVLLFVRGYYAAGNTKKPLLINTLSSVGIIVFAHVFVGIFERFETFRYFIESLLRVENLEGTVVLMLPLAYSFGMCINAGLLFTLFKKDFGRHPALLELTFRHSFYGSMTMGFVAYQFLQIFDDVFDLDTFLGIFSQGFFSGILGIIAGFALLKVLKNKEVAEITGALHTKFWKARPVAPEKEGL
jgi:putative peptidoglycan lipid II flippase